MCDMEEKTWLQSPWHAAASIDRAFGVWRKHSIIAGGVCHLHCNAGFC